MTKRSLAFFQKQIMIPQDHGSWVFILSPLLIGIFAGNHISWATVYLIVSAITAFMLRQPSSMAVKALSGRHRRTDLTVISIWILIYASILLVSLAGIIVSGFTYILLLAIPALPIFTWHLYMVSQKSERRQAGIAIIATGVLSLSSPAAFWIGKGYYDYMGWILWFLSWLQSAASIVYIFLRLEQREWPIETIKSENKNRNDFFDNGKRAFLYTTFNVGLSIGLGTFTPVPGYIFIPFFVQWVETLWGIYHPSIGWKPSRIGLRQLMISIIFTGLFILFWRIG